MDDASRHAGLLQGNGLASTLLVPKRLARNRQAPVVAPGRKYGKPHGTHIADMVQQRRAILLCQQCAHRFNPKRANYYKDRRFTYFTGNCDACRDFGISRFLFIHESYLTDPSGRAKSHHSWVPK